MRISDWSSDVCSSDLHSVDDVEGHPLGGRPDQTQQIATAFLNHLIGEMDMLRTRVDVTIDALHQPVMERRPARRAVCKCPDLGYHIVYMAHALLGRGDLPNRRSEEHTSELQSLMRISYDVFCLKKNKMTDEEK